MSGLYRKLMEYQDLDIYPFHMPGHKRQVQGLWNPYSYDITEIDGFDDLHKPEGVIREIIEHTSSVYGSEHSFISVNGSTGCILAAISATVKPQEKLILARNCHKSAYNGVFLRQIEPVYIYPQMQAGVGISMDISPEEVDKLLKNDPEIKAVFITSPTFEGVVSDVKKIAEIVHKYNAILIVDAAHGAHLGFYDGFPKNPIEENADIVIMSIHKTLPALTQTAVVCVNGPRVDVTTLKKFLDIYVSTSPSYVLMASIDQCMDTMLEHGKELMETYFHRILNFRKKCSKLKHLYLFSPKVTYDPGKIVICTDRSSLDGIGLYQLLLNQYKLQMEMQSKEYIIAMTSISDTQEGLDRLAKALLEIDATLEPASKSLIQNQLRADVVYPASQADEMAKKTLLLEESEGEVSGETMFVYPPGIPLLVPGERITLKMIQLIQYYKQAGLNVCGLLDETCREIHVLDRK